MTDAFNPSTPIYTQLAERLIRQIIRGELLPGDKLLSVREFGVQAGVNPNTVQRTYRELEATGIVESRRGQGTFVTENREVLKRMREELKLDEISHFVSAMKDMGYTDSEITNGLNTFLQKPERGGEID